MEHKQIKITYKPLWKLLIDKEMSKTDLRKKTGIAPSTFTKMNNDQQVALDILARICMVLNCGFDDIIQIESDSDQSYGKDNTHGLTTCL